MEPAASGGGGGAAAAGKDAPARPMTAAEEALKRSTDCVYFLASPLTCKKGNECEYRHSEGARVNPRDCWYWLNGNCLNPKCSFRHPPLDGLFGAPGTTSAPGSFTQTVATPQIPAHPAPAPHNLNKQIPALQAHASHNVNKQATACYFFQKGQCLKGDRCSFVHGPPPTGIPAPQQVGKVSAAVVEPRQLPVPHQVGKNSAAVTEPRQIDKESWALKECTQKKTPKASVDKPFEVFSSSVKPVTRAEFLPSNGFALKRSSSPYQLNNELSRPLAFDIHVKSAIAPSVPRSSQSQSLDARLHIGRDADEFLGESSPGFDVLADDAMEDADYPHDEDEFGRESGEDGRKLYPTADKNYHHSDRAANFEKDQYNGVDDYERSGRVQNHYGREQRRPSSERIMDRRLIPERRVRRRESPDEMDGSDLRHRLLKQRRFNDPRSIVSPDHHGEPYRRSGGSIEEGRYRGRHSRSDQRKFPSESPISTRLQGRIALPARSSPDRPIDMQAEREQARGKHRSRLSPGRPINNPGRNDRVGRRSYEDFTADTANFRGQSIQSDDVNPLNFAGPKSLAELKGVKVSSNSQEQSVRSKIIGRLSPEPRSLSSGKPIDLPESDVSLSFDGPKPLSDILKRKRESDSESGAVSSHNGNHHKDVAFNSSATADVSDYQSSRPSGAVEDNTTTRTMQESKVGTSEESEEEEGLIPETVDSVQSQVNDAVGMEEAMDTAENTVLAVSDRRNEESDYEAVEGADAKAGDDDNLYHEEDEEFDEDEDEDEDDFARKVGVMFS